MQFYARAMTPRWHRKLTKNRREQRMYKRWLVVAIACAVLLAALWVAQEGLGADLSGTIGVALLSLPLLALAAMFIDIFPFLILPPAPSGVNDPRVEASRPDPDSATASSSRKPPRRRPRR